VKFSASTGLYYDESSSNPMPLDVVDATPEQYSATLPQPAIGLQDYEDAVQSVLDSYAVLKGYRNADVMATFINSSVPQWSDQAKAIIAWRDACWVAAYTSLQAYNAGQIAQPSITQLLAALPPHP
jgi:hypothetical protein